MSSYREDELLGTLIWDEGLRDYRQMSAAEKEKHRIHQLAALSNAQGNVIDKSAKRIVTIGMVELQELMDKAAKYDELIHRNPNLKD